MKSFWLQLALMDRCSDSISRGLNNRSTLDWFFSVVGAFQWTFAMWHVTCSIGLSDVRFPRNIRTEQQVSVLTEAKEYWAESSLFKWSMMAPSQSLNILKLGKFYIRWKVLRCRKLSLWEIFDDFITLSNGRWFFRLFPLPFVSFRFHQQTNLNFYDSDSVYRYYITRSNRSGVHKKSINESISWTLIVNLLNLTR